MGNNIRATKENVQVGTILTYAYQWASRHPKFVRVIKRTPCSVQVEELGRIIVTHDGYGQNGTCIADLVSEGRVINRTYRFDKKGRLNIDKELCYIYDGTPENFYTD